MDQIVNCEKNNSKKPTNNMHNEMLLLFESIVKYKMNVVIIQFQNKMRFRKFYVKIQFNNLIF